MDEIKRKLALIDAEIHRRSLYAQAVEAAPLLFPAAGLMIGIICQQIIASQRHVPQSTTCLWFWTILLALSTAAIAVGHGRLSNRWRLPMLACGALACFVCLGAIRLLSFSTPGANDIRQTVGDEEALATIRGWVATEPRAGEPNWCFGRLVFADPSSRFYMSLDAMKVGGDWTAATGTIHVHVQEPTPDLKPGDHITVECWLHRFEPPSNPGQFDVARYLARINVYVGAVVRSRDSITADPGTKRDWVARLRSRMSQMAAQALLGDARIDDPDEGLVQALLLGSRQDIDPETYEAFRRTGLLHLVSLSGMNFAMLIGMIWWICRVVGLSKTGRALVGIVATVVFLMAVPCHAPTVRAAIIVFAYCAAIFARRRVRSLNSLCLAAIIVLWLGPAQLFDAGWQLSFGCMAGIITLTKWPSGYMHNPLPKRPRKDPSRWHLPMHLPIRMSGHLLGLFSTGLAAWIGGAGILLYHFHTITPLTSLWTALTFPLVWLIMSAGFLQILLAFLLPTVSLLFGDLARLLADLFIAVVRLMAAPSINLVLIGHVALWVVVLYYALVLFWLFGLMKRSRLKQWTCIAISMLLMGHLGVLKWQRTHRDDLRVTCLDVGHGQAIVAQLPGTRNVLFDAGSLYTSDVGTRIVTPFLDYMGIARLDAIVISHGDVDHINGIPEIVTHVPVGHLYADDAFFAEAGDKAGVRLLTHYLHEKGFDVELMPDHIDGGQAIVERLWPIKGMAGESALSANDRSVVSLIRFRGDQVLLCSDIESGAQRQMMALYPALQAGIVIAPHHGSTSTTGQEFLPRLSPRFVVCSCGRRDHRAARNLPHPAIPEWFHTSINGATFICIDRYGTVRVDSHLNHESTGE